MVPQITHVPADKGIKEISVKRVSKARGHMSRRERGGARWRLDRRNTHAYGVIIEIYVSRIIENLRV